MTDPVKPADSSIPSTLDRKQVHDLLTPLNAIIGFTGIVIQKTSSILDEKQSANLRRILDSGKQLVTMIRALGPPPSLPGEIVTRPDGGQDVEITPLPPAERRIVGTTRVLIVDDVASNRELLRQELGEAGFDVQSQASGIGCLDLARSFEPALVILDIDMPGMDGIETCRRLKADPLTSHIPVLFLTGQPDEATVIAALAAGGNDFLQKPYVPAVLLARVSSQIAIYEGGERLRQMVITDALTGLFSRRFLFDAMKQQMKQLGRSEAPYLSSLMIDVDHFKSINDKLGHLEGDRVLRRVSDIMRASIRGGDVPARFGGEEFVVVLPRTSRDAALAVAEKIRRGVAESRGEAGDPEVTVSVGVASLEVPSGPLPEGMEYDRLGDGLIREADEAMYRAKSGGRNRVSI